MVIPVVDMFAGPGGLGEGFASVHKLNAANSPSFQIVLSYEKDEYAVRTLRFRELYRACSSEGVLDRYLQAVSDCAGNWQEGEATLQDELKDLFSDRAKRVRHVALAPDVRSSVADEVRSTVGSHPWVLVGGPPCQAYSLVGRARNRGNPEYDPSQDERHHLYEEYLSLLAIGRPEIFVLENVKGLLSASVENRCIFGRMLADLSNPGAALQNEAIGNRRPVYRLYSLSTGAELKLEELSQLSFLNNGRASAAVGANFRSTIVRMEEYGAPQARHRVIILGVRADLVERYRLKVRPLTSRETSTVSDVISDLPALRSRLSDTPDSREAWQSFARSVPLSRWRRELGRGNAGGSAERVIPFLERSLRQIPVPHADVGAPYLPASIRGRRSVAWINRARRRNLTADWREWYRGDLLNGFGYANHESRGHMQDDLRRYIFAASYAWVSGSSSPKIRDFPRALHPKHRNVDRALKNNHFADRFRVQLAFRPSSTITSHIHKDGHYYIHFDPTQARSLTVREAARLQTFPDSYVFLGPRTEQYRQVGNAVPPFIAAQIADVVLDLLRQAGIA